MKLISPYKDYYDFLQGKYGIDEKIIYERICQSYIQEKKSFVKTPLYKFDSSGQISVMGLKQENHPKFFQLAICRKLYCGYAYKGNFYWGKLGGKKLADLLGKRFSQYHYFYDKNGKEVDLTNAPWYIYCKPECARHLYATDINEKYNCPVMLIDDGHANKVNIKNVRLLDFGIGQIITPEEMYLKICTFLTAEKPVMDKRNDREKISGHGFDTKTSFRHPIK